MFSRVIIDIIKYRVENNLRDQLADFRRDIYPMKYNWQGSGMTEKQNILYVTVVNLVKAFNSVQRRSLWKFMESYVIPHKKIKMIKILKEDSECTTLYELKKI